MKKQKLILILIVLVLIIVVFNFNFLSEGVEETRISETIPIEVNVNIDQRIEEILQTQEAVEVLVSIKGEVSSNYSSSIKNPKEREKWIADITSQVDEIQSKVIPFLSEDEFKIRNRFELSTGFYGDITKLGLEKLKKDPLIESIALPKKTYASGGTTIFEERLYCDESGGEWVAFPNPCSTDECRLLTSPRGDGCVQVMTESCNCGPDKCWNGQECVENSGIILKEKLKDIFYTSQCYNDNKDGFEGQDLEFSTEKFDDIQFNIKSGEIPYGHKYYVELLSGLNPWAGYVILTNYEVIEKQNADGWRIFGGVYSKPIEGGGSISATYGCLMIIEEDSGEILVEGWDSAI